MFRQIVYELPMYDSLKTRVQRSLEYISNRPKIWSLLKKLSIPTL